jgi:predicted Kef-type K+ transport protein
VGVNQPHISPETSQRARAEPLWGYLVAGFLNLAAFSASLWLASRNLSRLGVAFLAWPLLVLQVAVCLPAAIFAVMPRRSRMPRRKLAFLVGAMFIVGLCLTIHAIASQRGPDT